MTTKQNLYRDQERALHAYKCVAEAKLGNGIDDYRILVQNLGTNVRRLGLAGALSQIEAEARKRPVAKGLLEDLAKAGISGLDRQTAETIADKARNLDVVEYMLATRELLQVATWFKRAIQALCPNEDAHANGT